MSSFEENYFSDIYNEDYDKRNPEYKFKAYFSEIKPYLKNKKDTSLLDIGCAYGAFINEAVKQVDKVTGTDISHHAIEVASKRFPEVKIFQSDVLSLPNDEKFDVITCFDILEHVPDLDSALEHIKTLLKPDGILMLTVPVYDTFIGKIVEKLDKDPTHVHKNSRYWWVKKLKENKYDVKKWLGIWRYYFKDRFYLHYQSSITRGFTPAIMLICKK